MKQNLKHRFLLLLPVLCLALLCFTGCGKDSSGDPEESPALAPVLPDELAVLRRNLTLLTSNEAAKLSRDTYAGTCLNLVRSGLGTNYKEYAAIEATLEQLRLAYDAYQVYLLTDTDDDLTSLEVIAASKTPSGEPICVWGDHHKSEYPLETAYEKMTASADMFARKWDDTYTWTGYAPLIAGTNTVACILAIEYQLPDWTIDDSWNRMSDSWNGVLAPGE